MIPESGIAEFRCRTKFPFPWIIYACTLVPGAAWAAWIWLVQHDPDTAVLWLLISILMWAIWMTTTAIWRRVARNQSVSIDFERRVVVARNFCHNSRFWPRRDSAVEYSFDEIIELRLIEGRGVFLARLYVTTTRGYFSVSDAFADFGTLVAIMKSLFQEAGMPKSCMSRETKIGILAALLGAVAFVVIAIALGWI